MFVIADPRLRSDIHAEKVEKAILQTGHVLTDGPHAPRQLLSTFDYGNPDRILSILIDSRHITIQMVLPTCSVKKEFQLDEDQLDFNYAEIARTYCEFHETLLGFRTEFRFRQEDEDFSLARKHQIILNMLTMSKSQLWDHISTQSFEYFQRMLEKSDLNLVFAIAERLGLPQKEIRDRFKNLRKIHSASQKLSG